MAERVYEAMIESYDHTAVNRVQTLFQKLAHFHLAIVNVLLILKNIFNRSVCILIPYLSNKHFIHV